MSYITPDLPMESAVLQMKFLWTAWPVIHKGQCSNSAKREKLNSQLLNQEGCSPSELAVANATMQLLRTTNNNSWSPPWSCAFLWGYILPSPFADMSLTTGRRYRTKSAAAVNKRSIGFLLSVLKWNRPHGLNLASWPLYGNQPTIHFGRFNSHNK
jgi:hypothetical protein